MALNPPTFDALVVRPHVAITREEREQILRAVEYNIFAFPAALVTCDYLSDSGTSAMTDAQWAAMLRGDESYGRNSGYYCLLDAFRDVFERGDARRCLFRDVVAGTADTALYRDLFLEAAEGGFVNGGPPQLVRPNFFIVPQGRCAEALLFSTLGEILQQPLVNGSAQNGCTKPVIISNGFFDTTGANAATAGFELQAFTQPGLTDAFPADQVGKQNPFKGNLDIATTAAFLNQNPGRVALILVTITNNWAAGQPVSMANIEEAAKLAAEFHVPLFFDACRFAENAKFIQDYEVGFRNRSIPQIVQQMFSHVVMDALNRLGMPGAQAVLDQVLRGADARPLYFALDLHDGADARVKVYVQFPDAIPDDLVATLTTVPQLQDTLSEETLRRCFTELLVVNPSAKLGGKPVLACFAFIKTGDGVRVETTLHMPLSHYVPDDAEARRRIEDYCQKCPGLTADQREGLVSTYSRAIEAVAHRSLDAGRGLHAWVGLKQSRARGPIMTFYLSPEMFGALKAVGG
ncbi:beta-eliminating lyase-domain-containing protein [Xylariales sp. PMI_506]|nr:beta-eliminating lyase-domain-containing protein [Xylariales sp. PMI_506]